MLKSKFEGNTKIFKNERDGRIYYSTQLSQKNINGEWENVYINVKFKKGVELENKQDIIVKNGWLTFYKRENGLPAFSIFVNEFEIDNYEKEERLAIQSENDYTLNNAELPF
jgi:hypothetical protein